MDLGELGRGLKLVVFRLGYSGRTGLDAWMARVEPVDRSLWRDLDREAMQ